MASIFGASLRDILQSGAQFGLGVQQANRDNRYKQQQAEAQQAKALQEQMLAQALLEQRRSSTALNQGRLKGLTGAAPKPPSELVVQGQLGNILARNPKGSDQEILDQTLDTYRDTQGEVARAVLEKLRRQQEADARARASSERAAEGSGDPERLISNARGYAEELALDMSKQANAENRRALEVVATSRLRAKYPQLGEDEAGMIVRREFSSVLDDNKFDLSNPLVKGIVEMLGGKTPSAPVSAPGMDTRR